MPTRERHQLNFNLIWPLRKYTKEVVLGWLANGGMDDAPVGGSGHRHPQWDAVGQQKDRYPEAVDEKQRRSPWL